MQLFANLECLKAVDILLSVGVGSDRYYIWTVYRLGGGVYIGWSCLSHVGVHPIVLILLNSKNNHEQYLSRPTS